MLRQSKGILVMVTYLRDVNVHLVHRLSALSRVGCHKHWFLGLGNKSVSDVVACKAVNNDLHFLAVSLDHLMVS